MPQERTAMSDHIRVLIVDDHDLVRAGLVGLLSGEKGFQVVAEAADGKQAVEAALRHRPDVVVMDLEMPRMGGVAATRDSSRATGDRDRCPDDVRR
jgi:DNA-binding NarL/FixJ family response regulator